MLRILIIVLSFISCCLAGFAQTTTDVCDCSVNFGGVVQGDNYLNINFSDVEVKEVSGSYYLYFSVNLKSSGKWYLNNKEILNSKRYLGALDLRFDFNRAMFGDSKESVARIENVEYAVRADEDGVESSWGDLYAGGSGWTNIIQTTKLLAASLTFSESMNGTLFRLNKDTYTYIGKFRWKLKAGVTSGRTGVSLRIPKPIDYIDNKNGAYPTQAYDYDMTPEGLGICVTGESLDVPVGGGEPAPTISKIEGPQLLCTGATNASYKATTDVPATGFVWKVKQGGVDVTASVVDGTLGETANVSINWKSTANGAYTVCAAAKNATGTGAELCLPVTVNSAPTLVLSEKDAKTSVCAGATVNLVATTGLFNYKWYQGGLPVSGVTASDYSPKAPLTGNRVTYKVEATSAVAQGECKASAELLITINPLPKVEIKTTVANNAGRDPGKYGQGDHINMVAKDADVSRYAYEWSDGLGKKVAGTEYDIASATAAKYDITLTVTDKVTGCTNSKLVSLAKDPVCGITNITLAGTDGNRICAGGICRLTATVTAACAGDVVRGYAWYNAAGVRLDSVDVLRNETSHIYTAAAAGKYTVRVYTLSGMLTKDVTVDLRSNPADKVEAPEELFTRSGASILLTAECMTAKEDGWLWEPKLLLENNTQQYVQTKLLTEQQRFYVYVVDQNNCMSMDSTLVSISENALIVKILPEKRPLVVCKNGSMTLEADVSGGTGNYTYAWTDDINTLSGANEKRTIFKHRDGSAGVRRRVVTVTDANRMTGQAMVDISVTETSEPLLAISGGGTICEGNSVKVTKTNSVDVSNYTWYIRDNQDGSIISKSKVSRDDTIVFAKRGDYYVWVAAETASCTSDTTGKGVSVKVNGFDLDWSLSPANYKLGADVVAEVRASNGSAPYAFTWKALRAGKQVSAATANPNKYQVTGATESAYLFKVTARDGNGCEKTKEANVTNTIPGGLNLDLLAKVATQCAGGAALMKATASGGSNSYEFKWYKANEESNPLQTASLSGSGVSNQLISGGFANGDKIVVKVTDHSSPALMRTDTVTVNVSASGAPVVYAGEDIRIGKGASVILFGELTSGSATEWNWADVKNLAAAEEATRQYPRTANLTAQREYTVYVKDAAGCYSVPDKVVVSVDENAFNITINDPGTICKGNTVSLKTTPVGSLPVSWEWKDASASGQLSNLTQESPVLTATTAGAITVYLKAKNAAGVVATASRVITIQSAEAPILQLAGLTDDAVCSVAALTVSSTNNVSLAKSTWYLGEPLAQVQSGISMTYRPRVDATAFLPLKVEAMSAAGCPAVGSIEKSITIYMRPDLALGESSTPILVQPGGKVEVVAKVANSSGLGDMDYSYVWTHTGNNTGVVYTDGGKDASKADSAVSSANLGADGATAGTQPYYFQVYAVDGKGCHSDTLNHTISVNGDALYVELKSKYGSYCVGGAAILRAEVFGVSEDKLKYKWYKGGVEIVGQAGKELLVENPNATDKYSVEASMTDASKSGKSAELLLTLGTNTAATLTGDALSIPTGTKTALLATPSAGATITSWQWSPADKLAVGESALRSPYTVNLTGFQEYKVYGIDGNNCVTLPASVKVSVISVPKPGPGGEGEPDPGIFAYVYPAPDTICVKNMLNLHAIVWGTPAGATTYKWSPGEYLTSTDEANPVFNQMETAAAGKYSYTVKVTRGTLSTMARVDIVVLPGTLPILAVNVDSTHMACAGSDLVMQIDNKNSVTIKKYTWIINSVVDRSVTGNRYTWPAVSAETKYSVKVIAETDEHCMSNSIVVDSFVKPALKLNPLQVTDSCGQVRLFADAGADAKYTWSFATGASDLVMTDKKDTIYIKSKAAFTAVSIPYEVSVSVSPKGGGCQSKGGMTGKLYFQPKVKFEAWTPDGESTGLPYMVTEKGKTPVIKVDAAKSAYTLNTNATESWSASAPAADFIVGRGSAKINAIQKDDTVHIMVANKEASKCIAKDSMPVYLYPEAPKVEIDTNTRLTDIAIKWSSLSADSVRVWGVVEDAYNVLGNGYKMHASVKASALKWIEPNMNERLKFYYLQSVKRIQGRSFVSKVKSDTVGWLKQTVYGVNPSGIASSNNLIAYPFDMSSKGIVTDRDLYHKLLDKRIAYDVGKIGIWDFENQIWNMDGYVKVLSSKVWKGMEQDLAPGNAYWLAVSATVPNTDILMYGKLMRFTYNFELNSTPGMASATNILYPLSMINSRKRQSLGMAIPVNTLGSYTLGTQVYENANYVKVLSNWSWKPLEATDVLFLEGWRPVRIVIKEKVLNWTK